MAARKVWLRQSPKADFYSPLDFFRTKAHYFDICLLIGIKNQRTKMKKQINIPKDDSSTKKRLSYEPPIAIAKWGWKYHHLGIPYEKPREGETYLKHLKFFVMGFETSPYGIEWMRFEKDCPVPDILRKLPHVAFEVEDIDEALKDKEVLLPPGSPSSGVRSAMIIHDGALIELIEFKKENG